MNAQAMHPWTPRLAAGLLVTASSSAAHAAEGGLELLPDPQQLGILLVGFVLLVFPLNALLFRPIIRALDERGERITGTRAKAERLSADAQQVLERYESALREAREESELARRAKLDEARAHMLETTTRARTSADQELERARAELLSTLDGARETLRGHANELAREAAAQVLGRPL